MVRMYAKQFRRQFIKNELGVKTKGSHDNPEHRLQVACIKWMRYKRRDLYRVLFAVPNGGQRDRITAAVLRDEGVRAGVADLILLKSNDKYGALCLEMKTPDGRQSQRQKEWQRDCELFGSGKYVICRSLEDFQAAVDNYVNNIE